MQTKAQSTRVKQTLKNDTGKTVCGAKSRVGGICIKCRYKGERNVRHKGKCKECGGRMICASTKLDHNGRCKMHRGCSRTGPAHPNWRHGRYSHYVPTRLMGRLNEFLDDPNLLSSEPEVGLLTLRLAELASRLDSKEGPTAWAAVSAAYKEIKDGIEEGNLAVAKSGLLDLRDAIKRGAKDRETWDELRETTEFRSKAAEREAKRQVNLKMMLSLDEGIALMQVLVGYVCSSADSLSDTFRLAVAKIDKPLDVESGCEIVRTLQNKVKTDTSKALLKILHKRPREGSEVIEKGSEG